MRAVLDALSPPAGAEDTRSHAQRCHDGLQEAMQRLVTAGLLPSGAGQPVKALVHLSVADLIRLDASSALQQEWTGRVRAQWAARRAEAWAGAGDGGAWLDGDAAGVVACDAAMTPIVTGDINPGALETSDAVKLSSSCGEFCCQAAVGRFVRAGNAVASSYSWLVIRQWCRQPSRRLNRLRWAAACRSPASLRRS